MAARRVAAEAGGDAVDSDDDSADAPAGLFLPAEPKRRADWLVHLFEPLLWSIGPPRLVLRLV